MLPITQLSALPKTSGIYKVLDGEKQVIYVGQAKNIYERWNNGHHKLGQIIAQCGTQAYIDWTVLPAWLLNRAESTAIAFYRPSLNQKTPPVV
jgi:excinuclease UvrABC nuclease subunit